MLMAHLPPLTRDSSPILSEPQLFLNETHVNSHVAIQLYQSSVTLAEHPSGF